MSVVAEPGPVPAGSAPPPPGVFADPVAPKARFQVYVSSSRCFWRLLGRNNRAYARSPQVTVTVEESRELAALAARGALLGTVDLASTNGREWSWVLTYEGLAVARSDGTYGRRVECLASVERFRAVAPTATTTYVRLIPRDLGRPAPGPVAGIVRPRPRSSGTTG